MKDETQPRPERDHQLALLRSPSRSTGSGASRYAAAMYFYNEASLTCEMLEIYRICSKFDNEDPIELAAYKGVALPDILKGAGRVAPL